MTRSEHHDVPLRHNGASSRYGMVLCVEVDFGVAIDDALEHAIEDWVTEALRDAHSETDAGNLWHYVYGVRHDQWQDNEQPHVRLNGLQFTLAFGQLNCNGYDWPLFPNEAAERPEISAADVLQHFLPERAPPEVVGLGVSAVMRPTLHAEWRETVTDGPTTFCRTGLGAGVHWMRTLHSMGGDNGAENPLHSRERFECLTW